MKYSLNMVFNRLLMTEFENCLTPSIKQKQIKGVWDSDILPSNHFDIQSENFSINNLTSQDQSNGFGEFLNYFLLIIVRLIY